MATVVSSHVRELFAERAQDVLPPIYNAARQGHSSLISFTFGFADPALFPREDLTAASAAVLATDADAALNYGMDFAELRHQIIARLHSQGVTADEENVLISYGSSQLLALLPRVFVDPGDVVIIEGPSFMGAVRSFADAGAHLITIPTDDSGLNLDALEKVLLELQQQQVRPKFIYTIPTFHNPTGTTMPLAHRKRLLALSAAYNTLIVEDDPYRDLRFAGETLPTLASLDHDGRVIYISSFSKILAPGLRMGWAYAHPAIIERLAMFKVEGSSGPFLTRMVANYCADGRLEKHIHKLTAHYQHKCQLMLDAIGREFPPEVRVIRPEGGFYVWCELPQDIDVTRLLTLAEQRGSTFLPGTRCFANGQGHHAFRLTFSFLPSDQIDEGIAHIGVALREM
ncbi:MAG: PLP-dependent aminotransferase family protein [Chloroflexota bacterium]